MHVNSMVNITRPLVIFVAINARQKDELALSRTASITGVRDLNLETTKVGIRGATRPGESKTLNEALKVTDKAMKIKII